MSLKSTDTEQLSRDTMPVERQLVLAAAPECQLVVTFFWQQDRYGHRFSLLKDGQTTALLESHEGDLSQSWPPSPPLQEISLLSDATADRSVLLVGKAGKGHWSVCVETQTDSSGTPSRLLFDVACRTRVEGEFWGSTYKVLAPTTAHDGSQATMSGAGWQCRLVANGTASQAATQMEMSESTLVLRPVADKIDLPATVRWQYALELCRNA